MATAAEQLLIRIDATTEQLRREIRNAEASTQTFQRRTDVSLRQVERSFRRVNSVVRQSLGVFGGLAGVLSVQGIVNFGRNALATADEIGKMADQVGITTTELQRLRFAADQSGTSTNALNSAMERFTRRLGRARADVGPLVGVMEELGLNSDDNVEAFRQVADAIAGAGDAMEQARIADAAFGTAGGEMIRMLRGGREALDEFGDAAEQFGLVLSEENIRKAERLNDQFSTLRGILRTVAQEAILDAIGDDLDQITIRFGEFLTEMGRQVARLEDHQDALQFGIIGRILFGRRGMLIGAAIGAIARDVSSFLTMMGITGTPAQQAAQELFAIEEQIERHRRNIDTLRAAEQDVSGAPFFQELLEQKAALEALESRYIEVRRTVEETSGGLDAFNRVTRQSSDEAGFLSGILTNVGQGFISFGQAAELPPRQMAAFAESAQAFADTGADQELEVLRERLETLRDTLDPSREQIRRYVDALTLLKDASLAGMVGTEELREAVEQLAQQFTAIDDGASEFSDAWTSAVNQVESAFTDFIARGLRDFESFGDSLMRIAQQVAAQIVSTFVRAQIQGAMAAQAAQQVGGATQAIGAVGQSSQGSASSGLFGLSAGATAGLAVGAMLVVGALQRRSQRRRQEREERRNLEARERELQAMIASVGGLEDLTEQRQRELDQLRPANREIQERINSLEDELRVARERQSLEERAFRLMGNTTALREIEIRQTEEANRGLLRFIFALEDAAERVARAEDNVRQALAGVERAVRAENDRLRELQNEIRERQREAETELLERIRLIDGALSTMRQRRASLDPMLEMARARATLAIAQAGGPMAVSADDLDRALQIVASPSEDLFVSFEDYQRDFLRTKRVIEDIERQAQTLHSESMSEAEKQLEVLQQQIDKNDEILEEQRRAVNALFGIDDSVRSVEDAINRLQSAMAGFSAASSAQASLIAAGPPPAPGAAPEPEEDNRQAEIDRLNAQARRILPLAEGGASFAFSELQNLRRQIIALGGTPDFPESSGFSPGFADGGVHTGGLRIVGERGPELEMTGPSRIMSNEDLMSAIRGDRSSAEMKAIRAEIAGLRSDLRQTQTQIVRHTKRTRDVLEGWDVEGIPEERVQA